MSDGQGIFALEQRIMFDGAAVADVADATDSADHDDVSPAAIQEPRKEVVIVDPRIQDYQSLLTNVDGNADVIVLGENASLNDIATLLSGKQGLDTIHILSHGGTGFIALGDTIIDTSGLVANTSALGRIGDSLSETGDILLYGCDVGADGQGAAFVETLADLSGADVAASDDTTGGSGDWELEVQKGEIGASTALDMNDLEAFTNDLSVGQDYTYSYISYETVLTDNDGNKYVLIPRVYGVQDLDPTDGVDNHGETSKTSTAIQKFDVDGNFLWAKSFTGSKRFTLETMDLDGSGNIYLSGYLNGTVDSDPNDGVANLSEDAKGYQGGIHIIKLDDSGNLAWSKVFDVMESQAYQYSSSLDNGMVKVAADGTFWFAATLEGKVNLGTATSPVYVDVADDSGILAKFSSNGDLLFHKVFSSDEEVEISQIETTSSGGVILTGEVEGTLNIDPGNTDTTIVADQYIYTNNLLASYDANGKLLWHKVFNKDSGVQLGSFTVDNNDDVVIIDYISGSNENRDIDFGNDKTVSYGTEEVFALVKYGSDGTTLWTTRLIEEASSTYISPNNLMIGNDASGNLYVSVILSNGNTVKISPDTTNKTVSSGEYPLALVLKLDTSGNYVWDAQFKGVTEKEQFYYYDIGPYGYDDYYHDLYYMEDYGRFFNMNFDVAADGTSYLTGVVSGAFDADPTEQTSSVGQDSVHSSTSFILTVGANGPVANAAPALSVDDTATSYTELSNAVKIASTGTLSDSDGSSDWNGGTLKIQISANAEASDLLSIPDVADGINTDGTNLRYGTTVIGTLSASEGTVSGATALLITFNANATNALVQHALQAISYSSISRDPSSAPRTITITATDKNNASTSDTRMVNVTKINNEPVVSIGGSALSYTEGDAAITLASGGSVIVNEGSTDWNGGTLKVQISANGTANDVLSIPDITGGIHTDGVNLLNGTTIIGTLSASEGTVSGVTGLTITFNANATTTLVQDVVRAIKFNNTSSDPSEAARTVSFTLNDQYSNQSVETRTLNVLKANAAPTFGEGASLSAIDANVASPTGETVASLLSSKYSDEENTAFGGVVIVGNAATSAQGIWQYSTDGNNWFDIGAVSAASGLVLDKTATLRFVPNNSFAGGVVGGLTVHAVETTNTLNFTSGGTRQTFDTTGDDETSVVSATGVVVDTGINGKPIVQGQSDLNVTEQQSATIIDNDITFSGDNSYVGGYVEFDLSSSTNADTLALSSESDVNASGAISIVGDTVYQGNGSGRDIIGTVDETFDGTNGKKLRINLSSEIANTTFETNLDGWTVTNEEYSGLNGTTINYSYVGDGNGGNSAGSGTGTTNTTGSSYNSSSSSVSVSTDYASAGNSSMKLTISGSTALTNTVQKDGNYSLHGPYVTSNVFYASQGGTLNVDWKAVGGSDDFEVFGFLVGAGNDGEFNTADDTSTRLFGQRGDIQSAWVTETSTFAASGLYKFQFVSGTYDGSGGGGVGATLYVDNLQLNVSKPTLNDQTLSRIARLVTFQNSSDNPTTSARNLTWAARNADGETGSGTSTITIKAVNDAPALQANNTLNGNEGATITIDNTKLNEGDPDDEGAGVTYTLSSDVTQGTLFIDSNNNGVVDGDAEKLVSGESFTQDDIDNNRLKYTHNGSENLSDSFKFNLADGGEDGVSALTNQTFNISLSNVNDAPEITKNVATSLDEGATKTLTTDMLNASDVDDNATGLTYTLTSALAHGRLELSTNPGVAINSFTQSDLANNKVRYVHDGGETTSDSFGFSLADGGENGATAQTGTFNITVVPINDAPTVSNLNGDSVTFTEDSDTIILIDGANALSVADVDSSNFNGGTLTVSIVSGGDSAEDILSILNQGTGAGLIGVSGTTLTYSGTEIGTIAGGTGTSALVITFNANVTSTVVSNVMRNVTYANSDTVAPTTSDRTVRFVLSDGDGASSANADVTVKVVGVNDAPIIETNKGLSVLEDAAATPLTTSMLNVSDQDTSAASITYKITSNVTKGVLTKNGVTLNTNDTFTQADLASGLVKFAPGANKNGGDSFSFSVSDGATTLAASTFNISIGDVNDAPGFTKGADQTVLEDAGKTTVNGWATSLVAGGGSDENSQELSFTLSNNNNDLFAEQPYIDSSGNLSFTPAQDQFGTAVVSVYVKDSGNTDNNGVNQSALQTFNITVTAVNDRPSFDIGDGVVVNEDAGTITRTSFASNLSFGPSNESGQSIQSITLNVDNAALFSSQPTINANGDLVFTLAANANGMATVTGYITDDGTTANGGVAQSETKSFTIIVNPEADETKIEAASGLNIKEDAGATTLTSSMLRASDVDVSDKSQLVYTIKSAPTKGALSNNETALGLNDTFTQADIDAGRISFAPTGDANGIDGFEFTVTDSSDNATTKQFKFAINISAVNDAPSFVKGANQTVLEDAGAQTVANWATNLSKGVDNENGQSISFVVGNDNNTLFDKQPSIDANGQLTYTPADNANGTATVTVYIKDNGGTENGGVYKSTTQTFTITVTAVNDAPGFTKGADQVVDEDSDVVTVTGWASDIDKGTDNESDQTISFTVTNNNNSLFSVQPAIDANGNLTYTPAANANGTATVTVFVSDNGDTANGGANQSVSQTFTIKLNAINDKPVNSVSTGQITQEDTAITFNAANGNLVSINDVDAANDAMSVTLSVENGTLSLSGTTGLTFNTGDGTSDTTMTFTGTRSAINSALDGMIFTPTTNYSGSAQIVLTTSDQGNNGAGDVGVDKDIIAISIRSVNDAPTLTGDATLSAVNEDLSNPDGVQINAIIDNLFQDADADDFLSGIAIGSDASTSAQGIWQYSTDGGTTWANVGTVSDNAALLLNATSKLRFKPAQDYNGTPGALNVYAVDTSTNTIFTTASTRQTFNTTTDNATSHVGATTVSLGTSVQAVNDAPVHSLPSSVSVNEDSVLTFSTANSNLISISDVDVAGNNVQVTLSITNGLLSLKQTTGLIFSTGDGTSDSTMTFTGTVAAVNSALDGMKFTPTANFNGTATLSLSTNDQGGVGSGGAKSTSDSLSITVKNTNDAPTFTDKAVLGAVLEDASNPDGATVTSLFSTLFSDIDPSSSLSGIVITGNDANSTAEGLWQYSTDNGLSWNNVGTVSAGAGLLLDASGKIRFVPAANFNGEAGRLHVHAVDNSASLTFTSGTNRQTFDTTSDGQTSAVASSSVQVKTVITSVNDLPILQDIQKKMEFGERLNFTAEDFAAAFSDVEGGTIQTIKIVGLPTTGGLYFKGEAVKVGDEISISNIGLLTYFPSKGGSDSFRWIGSDGFDYASTSKSVFIDIHKTQVNPQPPATGENTKQDSIPPVGINTDPVVVGQVAAGLNGVGGEGTQTFISNTAQQGTLGADGTRTFIGSDGTNGLGRDGFRTIVRQITNDPSPSFGPGGVNDTGVGNGGLSSGVGFGNVDTGGIGDLGNGFDGRSIFAPVNDTPLENDGLDEGASGLQVTPLSATGQGQAVLQPSGRSSFTSQLAQAGALGMKNEARQLQSANEQILKMKQA
ncbi:cadherin-like domain-containing protein [Terasakiella sp.]|uniref:cadherin-like domain-containing protein n=1 Tax=Terasakiella sp. TaxID=2034861 RepID=UPI003AA91DD8